MAEAQQRVAQTIPLPQGYNLDWTGEFGALVEAKKRLAFIVPLSLLLILMLLYSLFNSVRDSLLALSGILFLNAYLEARKKFILKKAPQAQKSS